MSSLRQLEAEHSDTVSSLRQLEAQRNEMASSLVKLQAEAQEVQSALAQAVAERDALRDSSVRDQGRAEGAEGAYIHAIVGGAFEKAVLSAQVSGMLSCSTWCCCREMGSGGSPSIVRVSQIGIPSYDGLNQSAYVDIICRPL